MRTTIADTDLDIGVQETMLLVNHASARGTPAIFVIFVISQGLSSKALVLLTRMQIRVFWEHMFMDALVDGGACHGFHMSCVAVEDGVSVP